MRRHTHAAVVFSDCAAQPGASPPLGSTQALFKAKTLGQGRAGNDAPDVLSDGNYLMAAIYRVVTLPRC